jgi:restriction system protein
MLETMWMVRAGRGGRFAQEFLDRCVVGLGWHKVGDPLLYPTKQALTDRIREAYPSESAGTCDVWAAQIWRFLTGVSPADRVVTYDARQRLYHLGAITGQPVYRPDSPIEETQVTRSVRWTGSASRDALTEAAQLGLGSIATLFRVRDEVAAELEAIAGGRMPPAAPPANVALTDVVPPVVDPGIADPYADLAEVAAQRITDRIAKLSWSQMQELIAALLRALGYRTIVSPPGSDRGRDIFASPDGFGFEQPRIVVEVKHRPGTTMGAPDIRAFLGGRHPNDRGLYVSTGGFTREAYYEAERANIPLTLLTLSEIAGELVRVYDRLDEEGRRLLPLTRVYWPA